MVKVRKQADTLALEKSEQKKVVRQTKALTKKVKSGEINISDKKKKEISTLEATRGLVYIAHLPHGFYEEELLKYFKQFGYVTNVKVGRSYKTGNVKGFGYIEFAHPEVAKIAAETMNNYLMFKKRVVAEYVPFEKRPKHLFHGKCSSQNAFTLKSRWDKQRAHKNKNLSEEELLKRKNRVVAILGKKLQKLKALGINTDLDLVKPLLVNQESVTDVYEADEGDSEVEYKVKVQKTKKNTAPKTKAVKAKKSTVKEPKTVTLKKTKPVKSVQKSPVPEKVPKKAKSLSKVDSSTKIKKLDNIVKKAKNKNKKTLTLKPEKVKKIAENLLQKSADSLVNVKKITKKTIKK